MVVLGLSHHTSIPAPREAAFWFLPFSDHDPSCHSFHYFVFLSLLSPFLCTYYSCFSISLSLSTFWFLILRLADAHSSRRTIPQGFTAVIGILYSFIFKVIAFFSFSIQSPISFLTKLDISQPFRETIAGSEINVVEIVWFQAYYFIMV